MMNGQEGTENQEGAAMPEMGGDDNSSDDTQEGGDAE